jgi:hypothetical protein
MNITLTKSIALALSACVLAPGIAAAENVDDNWRFRASLYGFFPDIGGSIRVPTGGAHDIEVTAEDLIQNLEFATMGSFEVGKGRAGAFADAIYFSVGDSISGSTTLGAGAVPLPPGLTADASLDIDAVAVTLAGTYHALSSDSTDLDVFAGARMLDAKAELGWAFNVDLSPLGGPPQRGRSEVSDDALDAIAGVKGTRRFGARNQWFIPFYLDAGRGDSDFTWQATTGIGYSAQWADVRGDVFLTYRHLDYQFSSDRMIETIDFDGPAAGIAIKW